MSSEAVAHVARKYYDAWTSGDTEGALELIAPDAVFDLPRAGRTVGRDKYRPVLEEYQRILNGSELIAIIADDSSAFVYYVNHTALVADAPTVDYLTVEGGLITSSAVVFDRLPFELARREAGLGNAIGASA